MPNRFAMAFLLCAAFASLALAQTRTDVFTPTDVSTVTEIRANDDGGFTVTGHSTLTSADGGASINVISSCQASNAIQRSRAAAALDFGERCVLKAARVGAGTLP